MRRTVRSSSRKLPGYGIGVPVVIWYDALPWPEERALGGATTTWMSLQTGTTPLILAAAGADPSSSSMSRHPTSLHGGPRVAAREARGSPSRRRSGHGHG